ncbi:nitroreductase family deazaflavin-dependent oxidoreductase [Amycolatopsis alkalitolerans]|uniref:Nitroreductase family deazaflavin-dependent oxidoreductase n=1 Tax=Amycolatopsis alkalitolerans TaxID=2547244 RepID=A0A5C4LVC2_9PSEU|nr:nitroreductase family deazaflavin-dependent oxidoreductase [Amycolatopsis alkalitolerans]TNC22997.1 nitroreductase family deazaflavin-dependent oxidoreductase [Amycolatopsis alkalitolerans]
MNGKPVGRLLGVVFRAPIRLYKHDLGWLLTSRVLCLTHTGRRSGRRYRTALEVVGSDKTTGEVFACAGFGPSSDWYRNILANPPIEIVVGRRRFEPAFRVLDEDEAAAVMAAFEYRNRWIRPVVHFGLSKLLGWRYDGSEAARRKLAAQLPLVGFRPKPPQAPR